MHNKEVVRKNRITGSAIVICQNEVGGNLARKLTSDWSLVLNLLDLPSLANYVLGKALNSF